jgi:excisionase family DNA binding protein
MTADKPSRPLGVATTVRWTAQPDVTAGGEGMERLLSVNDAAEVLGTSVQFPRKLIAQRGFRFVRVGRLVRIPETGTPVRGSSRPAARTCGST